MDTSRGPHMIRKKKWTKTIGFIGFQVLGVFHKGLPFRAAANSGRVCAPFLDAHQYSQGVLSKLRLESNLCLSI